MKQHITIEQLNELPEEVKEKLSYWVSGKRYRNSSLMTIGQMIEFLIENAKFEEEDWLVDTLTFWTVKDEISKVRGDFSIQWSNNDEVEEIGELCDALWGCCKEVLNKDETTKY